MIFFAIDIGGTTLKYALIDHTGTILVKGDQVTVNTDAASFFASLNELITRHAADISGIGISVPGVVDTDSGTILSASSLPFLEGVSLSAKLKADNQLSVPIFIENDGNAAALAEKWQGNLARVDNGAVIVLGTGVGAALFLNGQLYRGSHFVAGEPSFMVTDSSRVQPRDRTAAGLSAVKLVAGIAKHLGLSGDDVGPQVFQAINAGDEYALKQFLKFTGQVAELIYNIQSVLDLDCFVIGGGISAQSLVAQQILKNFSDLQSVSLLAQRTIRTPQITNARFKNDANLIGAVYPLTAAVVDP